MNQRAATLYWTLPGLGETLAGKYVVDGTLGRGASAIVLSALDSATGQPVAIKVLLPELAGEAERFLREGRAAQRVESEHHIRVLDVGTLQSGAPYVVLEPIDGTPLDEVLSKWQPLPIATAVDWVSQACEAVGEAHLNGIVHGHLEPASLLLAHRPDGTVSLKVIDFRLAKSAEHSQSRGTSVGTRLRLTGPSDVMGWPYYKAPEQLRATCDVSARTDIWALGAVLYELLAGEPPFGGKTLPQVCAAVLTETPSALRSIRPEVPLALEQALVGRCLQKDPAARFATAAELSRALSAFGTQMARDASPHLERLSAAAVRDSSSTAAPLASPPVATSDSFAPSSQAWPTEANVVPRRGAASAKIVFGSLLMLTGVGAAAFLGLYGSVHGGESRQRAPMGVTASQASENSEERTFAVPPPPAPTDALHPAASSAFPGPPPVVAVLPTDLRGSAGTPRAPGDSLALVPPGSPAAMAGVARTQPSSPAAPPFSRRTVEHVASSPTPSRARTGPVVPAYPVGRPSALAAAPEPASAEARRSPVAAPSAAAPSAAAPSAAAPEAASSDRNPYEQESTAAPNASAGDSPEGRK